MTNNHSGIRTSGSHRRKDEGLVRIDGGQSRKDSGQDAGLPTKNGGQSKKVKRSKWKHICREDRGRSVAL